MTPDPGTLHFHPTAQQHEPVVELHLFSDASDYGWGTVIFDGPRTHVFAGRWSEAEARLSINVRELLALKISIAQIGRVNSALSLHFLLDNTTAMAWASRRVKPPRSCIANSIAQELKARLRDNNVEVESIGYWIESARNPADASSRGNTAAFAADR